MSPQHPWPLESQVGKTHINFYSLLKEQWKPYFNTILKAPLMHRRGKKKKKTKPPHFVTGVKEMDDGPIRTWHVPKNLKILPRHVKL